MLYEMSTAGAVPYANLSTREVKAQVCVSLHKASLLCTHICIAGNFQRFRKISQISQFFGLSVKVFPHKFFGGVI